MSSPDRPWNNNLVQFARLLCEIAATQDVDFDTLSESMDLEKEHIDELFERAHVVFEGCKKHGPPAYNPIGDVEIEVETDDTVWLVTEYNLDVGVRVSSEGLSVVVYQQEEENQDTIVFETWATMQELTSV